MKKILVASAVAAALISGAAIAKPGAYVGLNLGYGGMDTPKNIDSIGPTSATSSDHRGLAGKVDAGYLWGQGPFNYGLEMGYAKYANNKASETDPAPATSGTRVTYKGYNIDLLAVGKYTFSSNWNVFGKVGAAYVRQKTNAESFQNGSGTTIIVDKSKSKILPEAAIGAGYDFNNGVGLNLSYSHIFGNKPDAILSAGSSDDYAKVASVDMITFGVSYTF